MISTKELVRLFLSQQTEEKMGLFLKGILTPGEIEALKTRVEIVFMLKKGIPQKQIAEKLGVGIATVTRGSRELQQGYFAHL